MNAKYAFIRREEGNYPIRSMCRWAKVSRSGYYEWLDREPSATQVWREALGLVIEKIFADSDGTYGYRRVHAELLRLHRPCDPHTVRAIMAERGLVACQPRPRGPRTTIPADSKGLPDLVRRDFTAAEPGCKLCGDITYVPTWQGWVYLATVLDCCTKKVVGYAMADHMRTELVTDALKMAIRNGHIRPGVTIFHSDRGTQGEFNRSSQHLECGGVGWRSRTGTGRRARCRRGPVGSGVRIGRCGRRCDRRGGRSRRVRCSDSSGGWSPRG